MTGCRSYGVVHHTARHTSNEAAAVIHPAHQLIGKLPAKGLDARSMAGLRDAMGIIPQK